MSRRTPKRRPKRRPPRSLATREALWAPIISDRDLDRFWRAAMEPLGFGSRRFWITMIAPDGAPTGVMINIDDVPLALDDDADNLMVAVGEPLRCQVPGGTLAILFCRPGRDAMNLLDRRLALDIIRAAARADVPLQPIYFANDVSLRVFAVDDLLPDDRTDPRRPPD